MTNLSLSGERCSIVRFFLLLCASLDISNDSRPITGAIFLILIILAFPFFGSGVGERERCFSDKCCIAHLLLLSMGGSLAARFRTMSKRLEKRKNLVFSGAVFREQMKRSILSPILNAQDVPIERYRRRHDFKALPSFCRICPIIKM